MLHIRKVRSIKYLGPFTDHFGIFRDRSIYIIYIRDFYIYQAVAVIKEQQL